MRKKHRKSKEEDEEQVILLTHHAHKNPKITVRGHKELLEVMSEAFFKSEPRGMVVVRYMTATTDDDHEYGKGEMKMSLDTTNKGRRPQ